MIKKLKDKVKLKKRIKSLTLKDALNNRAIVYKDIKGSKIGRIIISINGEQMIFDAIHNDGEYSNYLEGEKVFIYEIDLSNNFAIVTKDIDI